MPHSFCLRLFIITITLLSLCPFSVPAFAEAAKPVIASFRDVQGITPEEIAAIKALQQKGEPLIFGMTPSTDSFTCDDGTVIGVSARMAEWFSDFFGVKVIARNYPWKELMDGLDDGTIAITGELSPTPLHLATYFMSSPIDERANRAYGLRTSDPLATIALKRKLRYAFLEGRGTLESVKDNLKYDPELVVVQDQYEAIRLLRGQKIDVFIAEDHSILANDPAFKPEDVFPVFYSPVSLATARKDVAPLLSVFDKYLQHNTFHNIVTIYNKGREDYLRHAFLMMLTAQELEYIAAKTQEGVFIPIAVEFDSYPSSFFNRLENEWQGIAIDVLKRITAITGLQFKITNKTTETWSNLLDSLEKGKVSLAAELIFSTARKDRFLWADKPYAMDYYALISRSDQENIGINQILSARVGLIADSAYAEVFMDWFPGHPKASVFDTSELGFAALGLGQIDFLMASQNTLLSATNFHEQAGYKTNIIFDRAYGATFGFHKDEHMLRSIISKAQSLVDTETITGHWTRKVFDYRSKMAHAQVPYLWGASLLLVCILGLVLILLKKNRIMQRELEFTVLERTAALEVQTEAARVASKAKGDFLSRMSHEIRTPLNAIIGMSQIARRKALAESSNTLQAIEEVTGASMHLMELLNNVLDMSKIEACKFTLSHEPFSILTSLRSVESIIGQRCSESNVKFTSNLEVMKDAVVFGDSLRLKQVLINLLGNAVKFTPEHKSICLVTSLLSETETTLLYEFTISDLGVGMTKEQLAGLFLPFEHAENTVSTRYGGTGLGLIISQSLVRMMGGEIAATSAPGKGSTFRFSLELEKATEADLEASRQNKGVEVEFVDARVLLVEDMEINRIIVIELLQDTKITIEEAVDGQDGLDRFAASEEGYYDLVFMDIQMPKLDGYETTRQIRQLPRNDARMVPIIALTANAYQEDIDMAFESGMNGHLAKPIDIDAVKMVLRDFISPEKLVESR